MAGGMPLYTPPQTPGHYASGSTGSGVGLSATSTGMKRESSVSDANSAGGNIAAGVKRESETADVGSAEESGAKDKRRRIAPTLISEH